LSVHFAVFTGAQMPALSLMVADSPKQQEPRLRSDVLCIEWDVKPYTLTHSARRCLALCSNCQLSVSWYPGWVLVLSCGTPWRSAGVLWYPAVLLCCMIRGSVTKESLFNTSVSY